MTKSRSHSTAVEVPPAEPAQQQDEEEAEDHSILPPDDHPLLRELAEVNNCLPGLSERLTVIDKIGEGTFSSVYKAIDDHYYRYENRFWRDTSNVDGLLMFERNVEKNNVVVPGYRLKRLVAIKKIYKNSAPGRILNEIEILQKLRQKRCIIQLIFAVRNRDQTIMVMPYFQHYDFRIYMHTMGLKEIQTYCYELFTALFHVHELNVVHRDIKPSNFLYDFRRREGVLVDFGLAQYVSDMCASPNSKKRPALIESLAREESQHHLSPSTKKRRVFLPIPTEAAGKKSAAAHLLLQPPTQSITCADHKRPAGYFVKDSRPAYKAPRAGTRGFRAPEVLFKVSQQTTALDIWSAGVILLSLLTKQFPFFNSTDDQDSIVELACLFGNQEMAQVAQRFNRRWRTNLPSIPDKRQGWRYLVNNFNPAEEFPDYVFDFLDQALQLHPKERIKASQALQHPFLKQYLDADMKGFRDRVIRRATLDTYGKTRAAERHWFLGGATTTGDAKRGNDPDDDDCDDDDADDAQVENAAEDDDDDKNNNNSDENGEGQNDGRIVDAKDGNNRSKSYIAELLRQYERPSSSDGEGYN